MLFFNYNEPHQSIVQMRRIKVSNDEQLLAESGTETALTVIQAEDIPLQSILGCLTDNEKAIYLIEDKNIK